MKSIIVLGSGYSGSGAVVDYLSGRDDVDVAFGGREFRLAQDPGGLNDLAFSLDQGFTPNQADAAIRSFQELAKRMARSRSAHPPGYGLEEFCPRFSGLIEEFLENITALKYPGMPHCQISQLPRIQSLRIRARRWLFSKRGKMSRDGKMVLPVPTEQFTRAAKTLVHDLIQESCLATPTETVVVNQAGSFWNPVSSTRFFGDRHVVVVTRNPADIFLDLQRGGYAYPGKDVEAFYFWYENVAGRINHGQWQDQSVIHVRFEDFVMRFQEEKQRLDRSMGLDPSVDSTYDVTKSMKNVGKGAQELSDSVYHRLSELPRVIVQKEKADGLFANA